MQAASWIVMEMWKDPDKSLQRLRRLRLDIEGLDCEAFRQIFSSMMHSRLSYTGMQHELLVDASHESSKRRKADAVVPGQPDASELCQLKTPCVVAVEISFQLYECSGAELRPRRRRVPVGPLNLLFSRSP
jgi:hypothetical protein